MDKYDRMLLSALLENGRASYADLARKVNLSAPAVAERVAKLEASGVITGYQANIDLSKTYTNKFVDQAHGTSGAR